MVCPRHHRRSNALGMIAPDKGTDRRLDDVCAYAHDVADESVKARPVAAAFPTSSGNVQWKRKSLIDLLQNTADVFAVKDVDWILLMVKCSVPAFFVIISACIAIPLNGTMGESASIATEHFAAGALIVTWGFELTPGYKLKAPGSNKMCPRLVAASFLGSFAAGTLFTASQNMWPYGETSAGTAGANASPKFADAVSFMIAFFVDGVVLANDAVETKETFKGLPILTRIRPAFTVLTLVVSIDNAVDGIGMYQKLDTSTMPAICYYVLFVGMIYAGGIFTLYIQKVDSPMLHSFWFSFGAFAILDAGLQLATEGLTTAVLAGFLFVWGILCLGGEDG